MTRFVIVLWTLEDGNRRSADLSFEHPCWLIQSLAEVGSRKDQERFSHNEATVYILRAGCGLFPFLGVSMTIPCSANIFMVYTPNPLCLV